MELYKASQQWATRPPDERFESLQALYKATKEYALQSVEKPDIPFGDLRAAVQDENVVLVGKQNVPATLTNWAFGQLASQAKAPADYLRSLPATLAVQNVNHGLKRHQGELKNANILFQLNNGQTIVRSISSDKYHRIWNYEVAERLLDASQQGWRVPPARPAFANQPGSRIATRQDILQDRGFGLSIQEGDLIAPAGIYASDKDMFVLLVNEQNRIQDGSEGGLARGFFVINAEVSGVTSIRILRFLYRHICGNHVLWEAENVEEIAVRHVGKDAMSRFLTGYRATIKQYTNESASDQEAKIKTARTTKLGDTKEDVLTFIFGKRSLGIGLKAAEMAYDAVIPDLDGPANTVYGFVQGATRASQKTPYMDERTKLDRAAGRVLSLVF